MQTDQASETVRVFAARVRVTFEREVLLALTPEEIRDYVSRNPTINWIQEAHIDDSRLWERAAVEIAEAEFAEADLKDDEPEVDAQADELPEEEWLKAPEIWREDGPMTGGELRKRYAKFDTHGEPLMRPLPGQIDFEGGVVE